MGTCNELPGTAVRYVLLGRKLFAAVRKYSARTWWIQYVKRYAHCSDGTCLHAARKYVNELCYQGSLRR